MEWLFALCAIFYIIWTVFVFQSGMNHGLHKGYKRASESFKRMLDGYEEVYRGCLDLYHHFYEKDKTTKIGEKEKKCQS